MKSGLILGLSVHAIPVRPGDDYGLRGQDLRTVIENDRAEGKHPFAISEMDLLFHVHQNIIFSPVGTVGTTSSGAIDNIDEIGETREFWHWWLQVPV